MSAQPVSTVSVPAMAAALFAAGVLAFPAKVDGKHPYLKWGANRFPNGWPTPTDHATMFGSPLAKRLFVVCGERSGGVTCMDFDQPTYFEQWAARVFPQLLEKLYIEQSQRSGGYHVAFKIGGGTPSCVPARARRAADGKVGAVRIEVRGEGNGFIAAPSPGYQWIQGDLTDLPILAPQEYDRLIGVAREFNECEIQPEPSRPRIVRLSAEDELPGTRFNRENGQREVVALFERHGYRSGRRDAAGNIPITRPGATSETSGNVNRDGVLHMFSTNTPFIPSEAGKGNPYTPFAVFTWLEHHGDYAAAGKALYREYSPAAIRVTRKANEEEGIEEENAEIAAMAPIEELDAYERFRARRVSVWDVISNGIEPPEWLVEPIVLDGKVTVLFGGPEQGKTWLMMHVIMAAIRDGKHVLVLDEESGKRDFAERMETMRLTQEEDRFLHYYPFALEGALDEMAMNIREEIVREKIDLMVFDSFSKLFAAAGLDENSNSDATKLARALLTPIAHEMNRAVFGIDHTTKVEDDSRYGRGAGSKLADVDVQWHILANVAPTRTSKGRITLTKKKDRTAMVAQNIVDPGIWTVRMRRSS